MEQLQGLEPSQQLKLEMEMFIHVLNQHLQQMIHFRCHATTQKFTSDATPLLVCCSFNLTTAELNHIHMTPKKVILKYRKKLTSVALKNDPKNMIESI
jgi:hypothetical protein